MFGETLEDSLFWAYPNRHSARQGHLIASQPGRAALRTTGSPPGAGTAAARPPRGCAAAPPRHPPRQQGCTDEGGGGDIFWDSGQSCVSESPSVARSSAAHCSAWAARAPAAAGSPPGERCERPDARMPNTSCELEGRQQNNTGNIADCNRGSSRSGKLTKNK